MARTTEGWGLLRDERTGLYTVRFRNAGKRVHRSTGTTDRTKAQKLAAEIYAAEMNGAKVVRRPAAKPLAGLDLVDLTSEWLATVEGELRTDTVKTYLLYVRAHWLPFFQTAPEMASPGRLQQYVDARLRKVTATTLRKECSALQNFLDWAARPSVRYLEAAPEVPRPPARAKGNSVLPKVLVDLSAEQVEALIQALPVRLRGKRRTPCRAFVRVLYETGLRRKTLWRLEAPRDYFRGSSELIIRGEADKSDFGRVVDLTAAARAALDEVCPAEGLIFPEASHRAQFKLAARAIGIPEHLAGHVSYHDFRHARTTHLLDAGAPLTGVAYLMGHKLLTTTNTYAHAKRKAGKEALGMVDTGLRGPR